MCKGRSRPGKSRDRSEQRSLEQPGPGLRRGHARLCLPPPIEPERKGRDEPGPVMDQ